MLQRVLSQWSWAQLGFFRAGEVPWNKGTSINILSTTHERHVLQGKFSESFNARYS